MGISPRSFFLVQIYWLSCFASHLTAASRNTSKALKRSTESQVALAARTEWETVATVALATEGDQDSSFQAGKSLLQMIVCPALDMVECRR